MRAYKMRTRHLSFHGRREHTEPEVLGGRELVHFRNIRRTT